MIRITEYFLKNHRVTNMVVALIILLGVFSVLTLQREQTPDVSFDVMRVTTLYPGASPEDVEINVTNKIEDQLLEVENIKELTSMSMENMSVIVVKIDYEADDTETTKRDIRDAVDRVTDLPDAVTQKPLIDELRLSNIELLEIGIRGDVPELKLRQYAKELENRLKEVRGVSGVEKIGYRKREIKIDVDLNKMKNQSISFGEIMNAIRARNVRSSGGTIESYVSEKNIITLAEYDKPIDVKDAIVRSNFEGYSIRLSDIAAIRDDFKEPRIKYRSNGKPAIALLISQQSNADIIDVSEDLHRVIEEFQSTLPDNIHIDEIFDFSTFTSTILDIAVTNGIIGFILVLLVMFLFLDFKSAFWTAFGVPFSILGAHIFFAPFGITINVVSLSSIILVLGIVVDDAIVITEQIFTLKQTGINNYKATIEGVKNMSRPITASILTTIFAFIPIIFIGGVMGKMVAIIPIVITLVLGFSLMESMLFIPAHVLNITPPKTEPRRIQWLEPLKRFYRDNLLKALVLRRWVIVAYGVIFLAVVTPCAYFMDFMLDQDIDQDFFAVIAEAPHGTSLERTDAMMPPVEELLLKEIPKDILKSVTTQVGHHDLNIYTAGGGQYSNWAITKINLIPAANRSITSEKLIETLTPKIEKIKHEKGFHRLSVLPIAGMDMGKPVHIIFISNDDKMRIKFEKEVIDFLKTIDGVFAIESSNVPGKDELQLKLDYTKLAQVGLTAMDVAETVRTAFDGTVVTSIRRGSEDIDFRVRIKDPRRFRAAGVLNLPVANREGKLIPMKHFAYFKESSSTAVINHYLGKRSVSITAELDTDKTTSLKVNRLLREKFSKRAEGIPGLRMKLGGQEEETAESMEDFYFAMILVVIAVYFLLVILFNSYIQPALIMSIVPFAVMSVFLVLTTHGLPLTMISLVGMLGLIGVVVNDTIVMISHLNKKCREEGKSLKVIADGAMERFRPVILTSLTTFAGLMPTAYGLGGDLPTMRPMVLVMAWGLVICTIVTLGFIPLLYSFVRVKPVRS